MNRANWALILPAIGAGAGVFIAAILAAHAYGKHAERRAWKAKRAERRARKAVRKW